MANSTERLNQILAMSTQEYLQELWKYLPKVRVVSSTFHGESTRRIVEELRTSEAVYEMAQEGYTIRE